MTKGIAVFSGSTLVHKALEDGTVSFSGSVGITGSLTSSNILLNTIGNVDEPTITFLGSGSSDPIDLKVISGSSLSFEGTAGQLLSITNNLTSGTIFSVNDVTGIPLLEADADGTVSIARFGTKLGVGTNNPTSTLTVSGTFTVTGSSLFTAISGTNATFVSITGSGGGITDLTASNINNFTSDVRAQFSAGTNIGINNGVISVTGSIEGIAAGGPEYSVQFNTGSVLSGSSLLTYNYDTNVLSGTIAEFTGVSSSYLALDSSTEPDQTAGTIFYDNTNGLLRQWTEVQNVDLHLGQQLSIRVKNDSGILLTKGKVVHLTGSTNSDTPLVTTASYESDSLSADTLGVVMGDIPIAGTGYALLYGVLTGINLTSSVAGDMLYLSSSGDFSNVAPLSPLHEVRIGQVTRATSNGAMFVRIQNGYEIDELHDVLISGKQNGDLLSWDSGSLVWKNTKTLSGSYKITQDLTASNISLVVSDTTAEPTISFNGSSSATPIDLKVKSDSSLSFEGTAGTLLYISDNLTSGTIFSVNDAASLPLIEVDANGTVSMAQFAGNVGIGTASPQYKLDVNGTLRASGNSFFQAVSGTTATFSNYISGTTGQFTTVSASVFTGSTGLLSTLTASNAYVSGNLGVGTESPNYKLSVTGTLGVSGVATFSTITASNVQITNLDVDTITAREYYTELVSSSIIYESGSTKFGDTSNDVHQFSGSIQQSGSVDNYFLGNLGVGTTNPLYPLDAYTGRARFDGLKYDETQTNDNYTYFAAQKYIEEGVSNAYNVFKGAIEEGDWNITEIDNSTTSSNSVPFSKIVYNDVYSKFYTDFIPVQPGETLYGEIWVMRETGATGSAGSLYLGVERYDKDKKAIASNSATAYFIASNVTIPTNSTWTKYSGTITLPLTHTPYNGSDGGPVRYVKIRHFVNFNSGTIRTYWGGLILRRQNLIRDAGNIALGSNNLFVDNTNNRVGIGTTSPSTTFHVNGDSLLSGSIRSYYTSMTAGTPFAAIPGGASNSAAVTNIGFGGGLSGGWIKFNSSPASNNNSKAWIGAVYNGNYSQNLYFYSGKQTNNSFTNEEAALNAIFSQGLVSFHTVGGGTSDTLERFRIDANGNVGIGTTSPGELLDVRTSTATAGQGARIGEAKIGTWEGGTSYAAFTHNTLHSTPNSYALLQGDDGTTALNTASGRSLLFKNNNNTNMVIASNGNVGIGLTNPDASLTIARLTGFGGALKVNGTAHASHFSFSTSEDTYIRGGKNGSKIYLNDSPNLGDVLIHNSNPNGKVGIGTNSPGRKLTVAGGIELTTADTAINTANVMVRRGSGGQMELDAPGDVLVNIDTNNNQTDAKFAVRKDAGSELFRIQEDGNVGIGTTGPASKLEVYNGQIRSRSNTNNNGFYAIKPDAFSCNAFVISDGTNPTMRLRDGGSAYGFIELLSDNGRNLIVSTPINTGKELVLRGSIVKIRDADTPYPDTVWVENDKVGIGTGATPTAKLEVNGDTTISGTLNISGSIIPNGDGTHEIGAASNRFADVYAVQTTVGAVFETGLTTKGIEEYPTGTVLIWREGKLRACDKDEDVMVMGVGKHGKQQPIILGAEPVLVTGKVKEGDWIVTSSKKGHGKALKKRWWKRNMTGKIIAQALESCDGESNLIKCMINKT